MNEVEKNEEVKGKYEGDENKEDDKHEEQEEQRC